MGGIICGIVGRNEGGNRETDETYNSQETENSPGEDCETAKTGRVPAEFDDESPRGLLAWWFVFPFIF